MAAISRVIARGLRTVAASPATPMREAVLAASLCPVERVCPPQADAARLFAAVVPSSAPPAHPARQPVPVGVPDSHIVYGEMDEETVVQFGGNSKGNTYQPSVKRRKRRFGFMRRLRTANGRKVVNQRRQKGRYVIAA